MTPWYVKSPKFTRVSSSKLLCANNLRRDADRVTLVFSTPRTVRVVM